MRDSSKVLTKRPTVWIGLLILLIAVLGCGGTKTSERLTDEAAKKLGEQLGEGFAEAKEEAQKVAETCFELLISQKRGEYLGCYGSEFYAATPKEKWQEYLAIFDQKLGPLESYKLVDWQVQVQVASPTDTIPSTLVVLIYKTKHAKHEAQEQLTMMKKSEGEPFKIVGHHVEADALLTE